MSSRRGFLGWFLGTSAGAMCASVIYPVMRYLVPPDIPEATTSLVVAGKVGELKPNESKIFRFGNTPALLVRMPDGNFKALSATCTHLSCTVQYKPESHYIWCACHNGVYDMSGKNVSGPPPRPLEEYKLNVKGDEIVVSRA
jgi:cytochrome b6-f complex iron-sulfur subunit